MSQLPSLAKEARKSTIGKMPVVAALPDNSLENLRRSAVAVMRRPPMMPEHAWRKSNSQDAEEVTDKSSLDSDLYSADSIKASITVDAETSKASLRNLKYNHLIPVRALSYGVFALLFGAVIFIVLQFAGIVELRYQNELRAQQLAVLQHQQDELTVELELMTALNNIESQAKALGMVFPEQPKMLDMQLASTMKDSDAYAMSKR